MAASEVNRPVWRSFRRRFFDRAVAWVRAGGHAVLFPSNRSRRLQTWVFVPCRGGDIPELSFWSLLALDATEPTIVRAGLAKGLAKIAVPRDLEGTVERWCDRDAAWRSSRHRVRLDCTTCAACCVRNRVVLYDADFDAWRSAGRADLARPAYVKGRGVRRVLRVLDDGACVHLSRKKCRIYALRPENCRAFPAGSESCLNARERELGVFDGLETA